LQDAARRARLAALAAHARAVGADRVALGHTADDQAETVLFRVIRGTGVAGLAGIPYRRDPFIRPLLDVRRSEVLRFLARRRLPSLTDPSNADPRFARARLRGQVLPELARENPRVTEALLALGRDARRVLRGDHRVTPGLRAADVVERLVRERAGTRRVRVSGADVEVSYGRARWVRPGDAPAAVVSQVPVAGSGLYRVCDDARAPAVEVALVDGSGPIEGEAAAFDLDAIPEGELVVRPPLPGDRLRPRGGRGSRKLAELLVDAKVPRPLRPTWPVLACGAVVLYVPGLRPSELARPHAGTRRLLVVRGRTGTGPFIDQTGSADNTF
jgi:tRNA(Ile)-lysidine synthase